jgi:protein-tyrosine-phosphatase
LPCNCPGIAASSFVEKLFNPVVIGPAFIDSAGANHVVENMSRRMPAAIARLGATAADRKPTQLCFAHRSHAKVSLFPLADRLAERKRRLRING